MTTRARGTCSAGSVRGHSGREPRSRKQQLGLLWAETRNQRKASKKRNRQTFLLLLAKDKVLNELRANSHPTNNASLSRGQRETQPQSNLQYRQRSASPGSQLVALWRNVRLLITRSSFSCPHIKNNAGYFNCPQRIREM